MCLAESVLNIPHSFFCIRNIPTAGAMPMELDLKILDPFNQSGIEYVLQ